MTAALVDVLEKEWQAQVLELAKTLSWTAYHTHDSRRSAHGFPDLVLVRDRAIYVELKREKTKPTAEQVGWLNKLASAGGEVYVWRPSDLDELARILSKRWQLVLRETPYLSPYLFAETEAIWTPRSLWREAGRAAKT